MSDDDNFPTRKPAKRVFARELNDATHQFKEDPDDDRSPNMTLLPSGELANRVLIAGTLTETDDVGNSGEYWRGRIIDNSDEDGSQPFFVYAGQYQPEAMNFLRHAEPPVYVAVVGKPSVYDANEDEEDEEPDLYVSIRPESITEVDQTTRDNWVIETANHTITRVQRFAEARQTGDLTPTMEDAIAEYGSDLGYYLSGAETALQQVRED